MNQITFERHGVSECGCKPVIVYKVHSHNGSSNYSCNYPLYTYVRYKLVWQSNNVTSKANCRSYVTIHFISNCNVNEQNAVD